MDYLSRVITSAEPVAPRPRVGFFGTGVMGKPLAARLLERGYPVAVWNRTPQKYAELLERGATAPGSPRAVAAASDVLIAMLMEAEHLDALLDGPEGILAGVQPGSLFIDMATDPPRHARALVDAFAAHGVTAIDAPVRGGVQGAAEGSLLIMVGGSDEGFACAEPLLRDLGKTVVHVGPAGAGQVTKAVHQLIVAVTLEAIAEALVLARSFGANAEAVRDVLLAGQSASAVLQRQGARMVARDWKPGRPIKFFIKDRANIADALTGTSLHLPIADAVFERIAAFVENGHGELDETALYTLLEP